MSVSVLLNAVNGKTKHLVSLAVVGIHKFYSSKSWQQSSDPILQYLMLHIVLFLHITAMYSHMPAYCTFMWSRLKDGLLLAPEPNKTETIVPLDFLYVFWF